MENEFSARITASCSHCRAVTTLTIAAETLSRDQHIACSVCGADLGSINMIMRAEAMAEGPELDETPDYGNPDV
jgi:hypothetical protein